MNELFALSAVLAVDPAATPSDTSLCEYCNTPFARRTGRGGKPQRFCSPKCRQAFHAQREQRGPTCSAPSTAPSVAQSSEKDTQATTDSPAPAGCTEFKWSDEGVVIQEQPETAVYFNQYDALVIRQRAREYGDDDPFVVISSENIQMFIDKLTDIVGIPSVGGPNR